MDGRDHEPEMISGQEAVEKLEEAYRKTRNIDAPIEEIDVRDTTDHNLYGWEDGTVTVAREMKKNYRGVFENNMIGELDTAFENTLEEELMEQFEVLEDRLSFLGDNFDTRFEGMQVAKLEGKAGHHGTIVEKFTDSRTPLLRQDPLASDYIVVDYDYLPWVYPLENKVKGPAKRLLRHEGVHAIQKAVNPGFLELWENTGSRSIERASTEGLARYEQFKGTNTDRDAETAVQEPLQMPSFWRSEVAGADGEASDPYSYGELAAYFIEESKKRELMDRISESHEPPKPAVQVSQLEKYGEQETRKELLNAVTKQELDNVIEEAAERLEIPFYGHVVEEEYEQMRSYLEGEDRMEDLLAGPEGKRLAKIREGEEAASRMLDRSYIQLEHGEEDIETFYRANARIDAAERLDFRPEEYRNLHSLLEGGFENSMEKVAS